MSRTALIILDLQNCFITDKTKYLPQKIKEHIETQKYDFIIFSKFINSEGSNFVKKLNWNKCKVSPEIDIVPELSEISLKNHIFEKNTYSIFKSKEFIDFLSQNKISKLEISKGNINNLKFFSKEDVMKFKEDKEFPNFYIDHIDRIFKLRENVEYSVEEKEKKKKGIMKRIKEFPPDII